MSLTNELWNFTQEVRKFSTLEKLQNLMKKEYFLKQTFSSFHEASLTQLLGGKYASGSRSLRNISNDKGNLLEIGRDKIFIFFSLEWNFSNFWQKIASKIIKIRTRSEAIALYHGTNCLCVSLFRLPLGEWYFCTSIKVKALPHCLGFAAFYASPVIVL